jgi:hypothetical protein
MRNRRNITEKPVICAAFMDVNCSVRSLMSVIATLENHTTVMNANIVTASGSLLYIHFLNRMRTSLIPESRREKKKLIQSMETLIAFGTLGR